MVPRGLELRTLRLLAVRSDQLSFETGWGDCRTLVANDTLQTCISRGRGMHPAAAEYSEQSVETVSHEASHRQQNMALSTGFWSHAGLSRGPYGYWPYALTS